MAKAKEILGAGEISNERDTEGHERPTISTFFPRGERCSGLLAYYTNKFQKHFEVCTGKKLTNLNQLKIYVYFT